MNLFLTVTSDEAEIIGQGLHHLPHGQVHALFQKLQSQILAQQKPQHTEPREYVAMPEEPLL